MMCAHSGIHGAIPRGCYISRYCIRERSFHACVEATPHLDGRSVADVGAPEQIFAVEGLHSDRIEVCFERADREQHAQAVILWSSPPRSFHCSGTPPSTQETSCMSHLLGLVSSSQFVSRGASLPENFQKSSPG